MSEETQEVPVQAVHAVQVEALVSLLVCPAPPQEGWLIATITGYHEDCETLLDDFPYHGDRFHCRHGR